MFELNNHNYRTFVDQNFDRELSQMRDAITTGINVIIKRNGFTHTYSTERTQFGRTVVTVVVNGNIEKISTERLLKMGSQIGLKITALVS